EKDQVKQKVEEANKGNFPEGTTVTIGDDGTATITYPDGSKDTIPGGQLVQQKTDNKTTIADTDGKNAEIWQQQYYQGQKVDPLTVNDIVPGTVDITKVADVKWDVLPDTNRALQVIPPYDDASAIITFTDGSTKKVNVEYTVYFNNQEDRDNEKPSDGSKITDKVTPVVPEKTGVKDVKKLTQSEKDEVAEKIRKANDVVIPYDTDITIADDGTATLTYSDKSTDTIPGDQLVYQLDNSSDNNKGDNTGNQGGNNSGDNKGDNTGNQGGNNSGDNKGDNTGNQGGNNSGDNKGGNTQNDAEKITPNVPAKTGVADTTKLTDAEKAEVAQKVEEANKDNFPAGTTVTVANDGTATINYPDGSKDTIFGDQLVYQLDNSSDNNGKGGNNSGDQGNQGGSNSGDQGNQGGNNSGDQGNQGSNTGNNAGNDQTDADKITPSVPGKTGVNDPEHLTDAEKGEVAQQIEDANKDNFPAGTTVTVADDGTATITYPDGSVDTIPGGELVYQNADANNANGQSGASNGAAVATIANTSADKNANKKSNADSKKLPQTGNDGSELTVLGSMMAMATLAFGAIKKRKN
ncbi:MAG: LPXTG cell wall anchor domain-containing protein, partial [Limosilactobacillus sp.]|uniref:LPXTG cell wall anchor domain-containing protein n=1 Tax=Limosilactobacillus sp. TaxID=2773925 RepID=UPI0027004A3A|nr:LPXTG cell wall anchor domain-containing protein [Limosilactobacillus sp.]